MLGNPVVFLITANECCDLNEIRGDFEPLHLYFYAFGKLHNNEDPTDYRYFWHYTSTSV
jgi:hypothetical protein